MIKTCIGLHVKNTLVSPIIRKLEFFCQLSNILNTKFYGNPSSGTDLLYAGRETDRHDEVYNRFSQFCDKT